MDRVVDDYRPVVAGVENDIDEIEDEVFGGIATDVSRRIYELTREVIAFQRATKPLVPMLDRLMAAPASTTRSAATCATSRTTRCASRSRPTASASCCRTSSASTSRSRRRR